MASSHIWYTRATQIGSDLEWLKDDDIQYGAKGFWHVRWLLSHNTIRKESDRPPNSQRSKHAARLTKIVLQLKAEQQILQQEAGPQRAQINISEWVQDHTSRRLRDGLNPPKNCGNFSKMLTSLVPWKKAKLGFPQMIAVAHRVHVCAANQATCACGMNNTDFLYFVTKNRLDHFGLQVLPATCAAFISEWDNKETLPWF